MHSVLAPEEDVAARVELRFIFSTFALVTVVPWLSRVSISWLTLMILL